MSADDFFDSNVLLYLVSPEPSKAARAEALVDTGGMVSIQVLAEVANVARRKFQMTFQEIRELLLGIRLACSVHTPDLATHELGLDIAERYRFSIYDSMLLASALEAGCRTFYSEDLHHGQPIEGLTIRNPFR
jgi:predicted nucleic acid-binding protein